MSEWPHASSAPEPTDDPSIPLLTDRIYLPAVELDTALPASLAPDATTEPAAAVAEPPAADDDASLAHEAPGGEDETVLEAELDRDLAADSDADLFALLSAEEPQPAASSAVEAPPAEPPIEETSPTADDTERAAPAVAAAIDEAAIEAQAGALRAAVLQRVASRLPEQVNATLRDLMQPAIDQAMAKLSEEAELALRITLQELVAQALREELLARRQEDGDRP
jgi:hypothetical protein